MLHRSLLTFAICLVLAGCAYTRPINPGDGPAGAEQTALDEYVKRPDPNFRYALHSTVKGDGVTMYVLDMTSQEWLTPREVNRTIWKHWLTVIVPDQVKSDIAFLYITGGDINSKAPDKVPAQFGAMSKATGTVTAQLSGVPNQPLVFVWDDVREREEDALIAYTWDKYLKTGDTRWPARLPMTKSAKAAMDAVTGFAKEHSIDVNRYVVSGGSKRGWTAWTTAAVDDRVIAVAPIVIDLLNIVPSFEHHYEVYGGYAPAVGDYMEFNTMDWTGTPEYKSLMELVEPFEYRKRLTMPKFIMNSTGDQFFLPDSSQFYFDQLEGEKYLRYVPNTDHGLGGSDAWESAIAWYDSIVSGKERPKFSWEIDKEAGTITVHAQDAPTVVKLWRATNPNARNFMKDVIGQAYASTELPSSPGGTYVARVPKPEKGWTAFFVELTYPSGVAVPFKFTTPVVITPDTVEHEYNYLPHHARPRGFITTKK